MSKKRKFLLGITSLAMLSGCNSTIYSGDFSYSIMKAEKPAEEFWVKDGGDVFRQSIGFSHAARLLQDFNTPVGGGNLFSLPEGAVLGAGRISMAVVKGKTFWDSPDFNKDIYCTKNAGRENFAGLKMNDVIEQCFQDRDGDGKFDFIYSGGLSSFAPEYGNLTHTSVIDPVSFRIEDDLTDSLRHYFSVKIEIHSDVKFTVVRIIEFDGERKVQSFKEQAVWGGTTHLPTTVDIMGAKVTLLAVDKEKKQVRVRVEEMLPYGDFKAGNIFQQGTR